MSLLSTAPFSSVTTYRKSYYRKTCPRVSVVNPDWYSENPIAGPLAEELLKDENISQLQKDSKEDLERVRINPAEPISSKLPLGGPLDLDVINRIRQDEKRSVYMVSYCTAGDYESKVSQKRIKCELPEDWSIPLTSHKCSYRAPTQKIALAQKLVPKDNLTPSQKEREILNIKTGDSIYISDISNTGMEIINGKLHGDVNIRPKFNEDDILKAKLIRTD